MCNEACVPTVSSPASVIAGRKVGVFAVVNGKAIPNQHETSSLQFANSQ
jgi:hypothetical protein